MTVLILRGLCRSAASWKFLFEEMPEKLFKKDTGSQEQKTSDGLT